MAVPLRQSSHRLPALPCLPLLFCKPGSGYSCPVSYLRCPALHCPFPSFHIRLNERCALTYPLRSALSLCEQLSLFSVPILLIPPFPVVLKTPIDSALHRKKRNFRLLWPLLTSVCSALSSDNGYSSRSVPYRSPWVPHVSFPPSICRIYCT